MTSTDKKRFRLDFFRIAALLALQNILTYSVNILDNLMLGAYSQDALAGAAVVNQIQYIVQQVTVAGLAEGLAIFSGQFYGKKDRGSGYQVMVCALTCGLAIGAALTAVTCMFPNQLIDLFLEEESIREESLQYLRIVRFSYIPFIAMSVLLASLRSMRHVRIGVVVSVIALIVNAACNHILIFGKLGFPAMGIQGAAIGTLIARIVELLVVACYYASSQKTWIRSHSVLPDREKWNRYLRVSLPCVASALLFSCASAVHTAIFGHISGDALAASSVSGTLYQFFKMIPVSMASAAGVLISAAVGCGGMESLREKTRCLQRWFLLTGVVFAALLLAVSARFVSGYALRENAKQLTLQMLVVQAIAFVGMAYQMPCQLGIIRSGGDTRYSMVSDMIYSWLYTVPLGLLAAFVWKWSIPVVTFCLYSDQLLKCLTVGWKTNQYTWIKELTKQD